VSTAASRRRSHAEPGSKVWWRGIVHQRAIGTLYALAAMERLALVRDGVPAELLGDLAAAMGIAKDKLYAILGVPRATMERKARAGQRLNPDESERIVGLLRLIGQADRIVRESGNPEGFDAARWVAAWLDTPVPALGGQRPATLMDTVDGRELVSGIVAQMQSGAYA
jgi:putative toxin-antitoxin system antitoxin component (TIGR02293 family)